MGGMYFTNSRYFSKGSALIPTELAEQDRIARSAMKATTKSSEIIALLRPRFENKMLPPIKP